MTTLFLVRGLPGSGKSTLAKQLVAANSIHIEADMYFVDIATGQYHFERDKLHLAHRWCQETVRSYLSNGMDVIMTNTLTTIKELREYLTMVTELNEENCRHDIRVTIVTVQGNHKNVHGVPDEIMNAMRRRFAFDISQLYTEFPELLGDENNH